jgi:hypothetical protein
MREWSDDATIVRFDVWNCAWRDAEFFAHKESIQSNDQTFLRRKRKVRKRSGNWEERHLSKCPVFAFESGNAGEFERVAGN